MQTSQPICRVFRKAVFSLALSGLLSFISLTISRGTVSAQTETPPPAATAVPATPAPVSVTPRAPAHPTPVAHGRPGATATAAPLARTVTSGDAQTAPSFQMPQVLARTQAALWTGDLTFSYPLALAPARAGFGPALALSYSSAAANGAVSTLRIPESDDERRAAQGGVLGYGWNLDLPTISKGGEWYGHETEGFTLNLGGQSYELVYSGSDNLWTTRPESFFRIMHDNSTAAIPNQDRGCSYYDSTPPASWETKYVPKVAALAQPWYVWTPDGTFYQFGGYAGSGYLDRGIGGAHNDATLYWVSATGWTGCNLSAITFVASQWGLVKAVDPHGNQYDITWNVWSDIGCLGWCDRQYGDNEGLARALAPHEISYRGGKVTFEYASGGDGNHPAPIPALRADGRGKLNAEWRDERLSRIVAQRQTGETTYQEVRRYEFAVGRPATSQWHETLQRIAWFGRDDNGVWQFPADVTFAYTQLGNKGAHALYLTEISNGAGGAQTAHYAWQGDIGVPTGDHDCWAGQNGRYVLNTLTTADGRGTSVTSYGFNTPQSYGTCTNAYANRYEFLGFADSWAQVGNRRTRQWYQQKYAQTPDLRRGLAYKITVEDATWGTILQQTETTWKCVASATENPTGSGVCAARDPTAPRWLRKDAVLTTLDGLPQERRYNYWADGNLQYDWEYGPDTAGNLAYYRVTYAEWGAYRVASGAPTQQKYLFRPKRTYVHRAPDNYCVQGVEYDYGGGYVANPTAVGDLVGQRTALASLHCGAGDGYAETRFTYDAWGNRTQAETLIGSAGSASNPKTTTVYDSLGVAPVAQTVVTGGSDLVTSTTYDAYGRPREITAPNGVKRRQTYDAWGRLCLVERAPAGGGYAAQQATAYSDAWRLPGGCADAANFADGSGGLNTLPLTLVEGEAFTSQSGMSAWDAKAAAAGGYVLGAGWGGAAGNYAQYDALSFGWAGGNTFLRLRYANNTGHANTLQVFVDGVAKGSITCEHTGGWGDQSRDYREVTLDLGSIAPGSHALKLSVTVAGAYTNVDRFTLTGGGLRVVGTKTFGPPPAAGTADPLTGGQFSYAYHDGLGRSVTVQTERNSPSGAAWATTHQEYDSLGRVSATTLPYAVTARGGAVPDPNPNPRQTTAYDALGRVVSQTEPNGATTSLAYYYARWDPDWDFMGGRRVQQRTDAAGNISKRTAYDAFGRVTSVTEFPNGYGAYPEYRTRYTYDVLDRLTQVQDALGNVTTLTYNGAGWKLALTDPDMGAWSYRYDTAGRLVQQRDAKQQRTCTYYDRAGRVVGTQYLPTDCPASQPTPPHVTLSYDGCANGVGQMCSQTTTYSVSHTITLAYDTLGRLSQETRVISAGGSGTYRTQTAYDAQDRPATIIYPDATGSGGAGESVTTTYDAGGRAYSLTANGTALAQTTLYTAGGAVYRQTLGNGRCTQNDYDVNQRLQQRRVGPVCGQNSGALLNLVYTYDLVGNVASIQNVISNTTTTFAYDLRLQRLTGASGEYSATYAYDAVGNLTRKVEGSQVLTLTYSAAQPAHGVKAVNGAALQYDATGNLTRTIASGVVYTQTWDRANRLAMVTSGSVTVTFGYDAAGALAVKTVRQGSAVTTTHYIGGYYERTINGAARRYYRLGDQLVLREGTAPYQYLYGDHLNSATLTTDAAGTKTSETRYYPYGAHRYDWGNDPSDRDFTGQRRDAEIALLDYVARRYSPYLGRFVSPDTIIPNPGNPQDLNRYAYVRNNPIKYRDPSGHWVETAFDVVSLGMTLNDIRNEGLTAWNAVSLVTDVASVALPIVPAGASHMIRASKLAARALNALDTATDASKLLSAADTMADTAKFINGTDNASDTVRMANDVGEVSLFGKANDPRTPQTRPGRDGKVSCTSCSPVDGIRNSFGREPTSDDMYWPVNAEAVRANGGQVTFDGGQRITDISGTIIPNAGSYPTGHVSVSFPGQSKSWVERNLGEWLRLGKKVLPD